MTKKTSKQIETRRKKIIKELLDRNPKAALGFKATSARDWLYKAYSASGENLYEAIHDNPGNLGLADPDRLQHRYIDEDVPMSLVPLASIMRGKDFWAESRTADSLGINDMSVKEIRLLAVTGRI